MRYLGSSLKVWKHRKLRVESAFKLPEQSGSYSILKIVVKFMFTKMA